MKRTLLIAALIATPLLAANPPKLAIALPDGFAPEMVPIEFKHWMPGKEPFKFGPYRVTEYQRGPKLMRTAKSGVVPIDVPDPLHVEAERQKYNASLAFTLVEGDAPAYYVGCRGSGESQGTSVRGVPVTGQIDERYLCSIEPADEARPRWMLSMTNHGTLRQFRIFSAGTLTDGTTTVQVDGAPQAKEVRVRMPLPLGAIFTNGDKAEAAVQIGGPVMFAPSLDAQRRGVYAAAMAAMILAQQD